MTLRVIAAARVLVAVLTIICAAAGSLQFAQCDWPFVCCETTVGLDKVQVARVPSDYARFLSADLETGSEVRGRVSMNAGSSRPYPWKNVWLYVLDRDHYKSVHSEDLEGQSLVKVQLEESREGEQYVYSSPFNFTCPKTDTYYFLVMPGSESMMIEMQVRNICRWVPQAQFWGALLLIPVAILNPVLILVERRSLSHVQRKKVTATRSHDERQKIGGMEIWTP
jgi:hypothetical protein